MSLPLTRSGPFEEFPAGAGFETLFPELPPPGMRPVEVAVTVEGGRCIMHVVTAEAQASRAFSMAFEACEGMEEFEVTARRFRG